MATTDWPAALQPQAFSASLRKAGLVFRSPFNGTAQAIDFIAERWVFSLVLPPRLLADAGAVEALAFGLAGGIERVRCWHFARPAPRGTMRGAPALSAAAARGNTTLAITTTANATLKAGDMIGAGGQLFMVAADATASGGGAITVPLVNRVRAAIAGAAPVTWDKPKSEFIASALVGSVAFRPRVLEGAAFDLEEVF